MSSSAPCSWVDWCSAEVCIVGIESGGAIVGDVSWPVVVSQLRPARHDAAAVATSAVRCLDGWGVADWRGLQTGHGRRDARRKVASPLVASGGCSFRAEALSWLPYEVAGTI